MFKSIYKVLGNIEKLDSDLIAVSIYYDKDIQKLILRGNRIDQLSHGEDIFGEVLGFYKPITDISSDGMIFTFEDISVQKIAGQPYNYIDTGEFFSSFKVVVYADGFSIIANDQKEDGQIKGLRGKKFLGLNDENKTKLVQAMLPLFRELTRKKIFA